MPMKLLPVLIALPLAASLATPASAAKNKPHREAPAEQAAPVLPVMSPFQSQPSQYIEVFNRGAVNNLIT